MAAVMASGQSMADHGKQGLRPGIGPNLVKPTGVGMTLSQRQNTIMEAYLGRQTLALTLIKCRANVYRHGLSLNQN